MNNKLNNKLKPCPFNIGDKVYKKTGHVQVIGVVSEIVWCFDDWLFTVAPSFLECGKPDPAYRYRSTDIELIERPDTLEVANFERLEEDISVAIAEKFLIQPNNITWEDRTAELANVVMPLIRNFYRQQFLDNQ